MEATVINERLAKRAASKRRACIRRCVITVARKLADDDYRNNIPDARQSRCQYWDDPILVSIVARLVDAQHRHIDIPRAAYREYCGA